MPVNDLTKGEDDDLFGSALELEQAHYQEGYNDGICAGHVAGRQEGKALGIQKGFEIGHELGYISGSVAVWRRLHPPLLIPPRAEKAITALEQLLKEFPYHNPRDERMQALLDTIRGRYKTIHAMLHTTPPSQQQQQHVTSSTLDF